MTIEEAIQDLEVRKRVLQASCYTCWDPAIEMALQALKEKKDHPVILCKNCRFARPRNPEMDTWLCNRHKWVILSDDYCSDAEVDDE